MIIVKAHKRKGRIVKAHLRKGQKETVKKLLSKGKYGGGQPIKGSKLHPKTGKIREMIQWASDGRQKPFYKSHSLQGTSLKHPDIKLRPK